MRSNTRADFNHLNLIQNQDDAGKRKKARKRSSYKRMWIDADKAFHDARKLFDVTKEVRTLLQHPDLKSSLDEKAFAELVEKAKHIAKNTKEKVAELEAMRDEHLLIRSKYPKTQRQCPGQTEIIDNLQVISNYEMWTRSAMEAVILPCAELMELVESANLETTGETEPASNE